MRIMIKKLVQANRKIVTSYLNFTNRIFGSIDDYEDFFRDKISKLSLQNKVVLELGGANRPIFSKGRCFKYIGLDLDNSFNWEYIYDEYINDSAESDQNINADIIISAYLFEHIRNNKKALLNIKKWLNKDGFSIHIFPLKYHPYSIINQIIGNKLGKKLIPILRPGSESVTGYPAYYNLCSSFGLESFLTKNNFKFKVKYFYGAEDYFAFFFLFGIVINIYNRICKVLNIKLLASNVVLILE